MVNYSYSGYEDISIYRLSTIGELRNQFPKSLRVCITIRNMDEHDHNNQYKYDDAIIDIDKPISIKINKRSIRIICNILTDPQTKQ